MTLGNMRANGVRARAVRCPACHRPVVLPVEDYGDEVPVPAFGPRIPDLAKKEQAAGMASALHEALQKLAAFLKTALREETKERLDEAVPCVHTALLHHLPWTLSGAVNILEATKRMIDSLLDRLYQHDGLACGA